MSSRQTSHMSTTSRWLIVLTTLVAALALSAGTASATVYGPCKLTLTPKSSSNAIGTNKTFNAKLTLLSGSTFLKATKDCLKNGGTPAGAGKTVRFKVLSGPKAGTTATAVTNSSSIAQWTYTSSSAGLDIVKSWYSDAACASTLSPGGFLLSGCSLLTPWVWDVASTRWFNPYDCHSSHHHSRHH